jgi:hypothetical protein
MSSGSDDFASVRLKNAVILCKGILIPYRFSGKGIQYFLEYFMLMAGKIPVFLRSLPGSGDRLFWKIGTVDSRLFYSEYC